MGIKMLLLGYFLLPVILVTGKELRIRNYIVEITNNSLNNVQPIGEQPDELDFSGLGLQHINESAFKHVFNVRSINLANNSIRNLFYTSLEPLWNLKYLSLANNSIETFYKPFAVLDRLETLDLSNNPLSVLLSMRTYGLKRCNIIVKGAGKINEVANADFGYHKQRTLLPRPLTRILIDIWQKCFGENPFIYVEDPPNESMTLADEEIKCQRFDVERRVPLTDFHGHSLNRNIRVEACIQEGTLNRLSVLPNESTNSMNCYNVPINYDERSVNLASLGIENFAKNWYRLENISIHSIDLSSNKITRLTNNLLNDLPATVKHVRLSGNKIVRLEAITIQNEHLAYLDLSDNGLRVIEANSLNNTNLLGLILEHNSFTDTRFVANLPSSLQELYLSHNQIAEVSANSFAQLNHLFYLDLSLNKITELGSQSLRGLTSLQQLLLSDNGLRKIEAGAFQDLGQLRSLDLNRNGISELNKDTFTGLKEILFLEMNYNNLTKVTKDSFKGIPDTLRTLYLMYNRIESLEEGSFVKIPKYRLFLNGNKISKVEKDNFDIPSLQVLEIEDNRITEIKMENFDMPKLLVLNLANNLIRNIESGAFRKLGKVDRLDLSDNPFVLLREGSLFGFSNSDDGTIYLDNVPLEIIHGHAFRDEREKEIQTIIEYSITTRVVNPH